jgi:hypothetical protein
VSDSSSADPAVTQPMPRLGGRYLLLRQLSQGGMGSVYEGRDEELDRPVAIKILHDPSDPAAVERFRREAQAVAALEHPGIVSIYDYGVDDGRHYLVLELVRGRDLVQLLASEGPCTPVRAIDTAAQVCEALAHAHAAGIVHRDIKPGNILLARGGEVRVTDFGIARMTRADGLTLTGSMMGSARYCAPEQVAGDPVGPAADLYALGVVLYEMVTGEPPFDGDHPAGVALRRLTEPVPPPSRARPSLSASLDAVVARATARQPADRYASAEQFRDALRAAAAPATGSTRQMPTAVMPTSAEPPVRDTLRRTAGRWSDRIRAHARVRPRLAFPVLLMVLVLAAVPLSQQASRDRDTSGAPGAGPAPTDASSGTAATPEAVPSPAAGPASRTPVAPPPSDATFEITGAILGLDGAKVADRLRTAGFAVEVAPRPSAEPAGTVIGVDPPVGSRVQPGDAIVLRTAG